MFTRPFLPFRVRPLRETRVRPSPLAAVAAREDTEDLQPAGIRAPRRPIRAVPVVGPGKAFRSVRIQKT